MKTAILALIKTKLFIGIAAATVTVSAAAVTVAVVTAPDTYRIIKVSEVTGEAIISRKDTGEIDAYSGMSLENGDKIIVAPESKMRLALDDDKYILLDSSTELTLEADGSTKKSRTLIKLEKGTILNEITKKLNKGSTYEVNTPTSTMSVRGTVFTVTVTEDGDETYTDVQVLDGTVAGKIIYPDGTSDGKEVLIPKGKAAKLKKDEKTTIWVFDDEDIDLNELPREVLIALKNAAEGGTKLSATVQEIIDVLFPPEETQPPQSSDDTTSPPETTPEVTPAIVTTVPPTMETTPPTTVPPVTTTPAVVTTPPTTIPPVTTTPATTTTPVTTTTPPTTVPPVTDPPVTVPPATDPPVTNPPITTSETTTTTTATTSPDTPMTLPEPPIGRTYTLYYTNDYGFGDGPSGEVLGEPEFSKSSKLGIGDTITAEMIVIYTTSDTTGTHQEEVTYHFSHTISEGDFEESEMGAEVTIDATENNNVWISFVLSSENMC